MGVKGGVITGERRGGQAQAPRGLGSGGGGAADDDVGGEEGAEAVGVVFGDAPEDGVGGGFEGAFGGGEVGADGEHEVGAGPGVIEPVAVAGDIEAAGFLVEGHVDDEEIGGVEDEGFLFLAEGAVDLSDAGAAAHEEVGHAEGSVVVGAGDDELFGDLAEVGEGFEEVLLGDIGGGEVDGAEAEAGFEFGFGEVGVAPAEVAEGGIDDASAGAPGDDVDFSGGGIFGEEFEEVGEGGGGAVGAFDVGAGGVGEDALAGGPGEGHGGHVASHKVVDLGGESAGVVKVDFGAVDIDHEVLIAGGADGGVEFVEEPFADFGVLDLGVAGEVEGAGFDQAGDGEGDGLFAFGGAGDVLEVGPGDIFAAEADEGEACGGAVGGFVVVVDELEVGGAPAGGDVVDLAGFETLFGGDVVEGGDIEFGVKDGCGHEGEDAGAAAGGREEGEGEEEEQAGEGGGVGVFHGVFRGWDEYFCRKTGEGSTMFVGFDPQWMIFFFWSTGWIGLSYRA